MTEIYDLRTNHLSSPLGVETAAPRFSWKLKSDESNVMQLSYRVTAHCGDTLLWDSGVTDSKKSHNIVYQGVSLNSRQIVRWTVQVETTAGSAGASSVFEMGLLSREDWKGKWIEPEDRDFHIMELTPAPYLRRVFSVRPGLKRARIYHTAHGMYRFWINGQKGSERVFAPGNTSYYKRLQYQVDDITALLSVGENVWALRLGDGWWRGGCGASGTRFNYGKKVHYLGQIVLDYQDGSTEIIPTDESFKTALGGLLENDLKVGTVFDASLEPEGWQNRGFSDESWRHVHLAAADEQTYDNLIGEISVPVREMERLPGHAFTDAAGSLVVDFGQNIAGYVHMKLRGLKKGQRVFVEHGEALNEGVFDPSNVYIKETTDYDRFQTVTFIADGPEAEYCPEFSIFGFRYVRVTGYDGPILPGDFTAVAVYSDMPVTYDFECSNPLVNQLVKNSLWSQKGNFLDVPTDCPTRERAPWSGDAQVYCKTAAEMMDVYTFFEKWMQDLAAEQGDSGQVPSIAPSTFFHNEKNGDEYMEYKMRSRGGGHMPMPKKKGGGGMEPSVGWGDAATIIPYRLYTAYGDKTILENQYSSAKLWVDCMLDRAKPANPTYKDEPWNFGFDEKGVPDADFIWDSGFHFGEWSEPGFVHRTMPKNFHEDRVKTGDPVTATAYLRYSLYLMSEFARVLGKEDERAHYSSLSDKVAALYEKYLITDEGEIRFSDEGRQAAYVRAIAFDLCRGEKRKKVAEYLLRLVERQDYHLNTGFLSTPMLLNVLTDCGYTDAAYRVLEQTSAPSWLFPITKGATTIYESWDGATLFFGSFNHYSFGAVCDYLFSYVNGIRLDESNPGYSHFFLKPVPGGTLTYARSVFESPFGPIKSSWEKKDGCTEYSFTVPANTTAHIQLPDGTAKTVGSGSYTFRVTQ